MNNARWWIVLGVVVWAGLSHGAGYYWDVNGTLTGSGGPTPNGVWDGANTFWNTDSAGGAGTLVSNPATSDTLTLSAGTDATGTYAIAVSGTQNAGTIVFKDGSPTIAGGTLSFAATGVITLNSGITGSIGSCIAGVGTVLYKNGTGTLTLTGTNVYTGTTQIYGATESTLVLSNTQGYAISGNVYMGWPGGGGSGGTLRLAANNQIPPTSVITFGHAYGGQHAYFVLNGFSTSVAGLNNGSDLGGEIYNGSAADATITLAGSGVYDFGPISGYFGNIWDGATGKLGFVKSGSGTQTFSGNNSYTGGTTINAGWMRVATSTALGGAGSTITFGGGTLQAGASVSLGNSTLNLGTGNAVIDTVGNTLTLTGILGGGALTKVGTGTLTLNGINAFTSPLTNSAGALVVGGAGKLGAGSYAADILNGGAFVFNSSAGQTLGGVISGSGSLTVSGTGTLTLTGNNTYGSPTTVLAGTLCVNTPGGNGLAGDVTLVGGTLGGTGTVAGTVVVNNLGHVAPGNGVGVQSYGSFTLNTGSFLDLEFDGTTNDQVVVNSPGGLTLTGGWVSFYNNGAATPYSTPGTYNLIQYAGTIGGSGVSALGVANPVAGVSWRFDTAGGWVVATLTAQKVWDGGGIDNNLATPENWNPDGTPVEYDGLAFAGTTRLTPNNNYAANTKFTGITFNGGAGAFTLGGNAMGLSGAVLNNSSVAQTLNMDIQLAGNLVVTNVGAASLTLGGTVSESGGSRALMKNGSGTLTLTGTGTNTISGLVTVNAGGLGLAKAGNIAAVQGSVTMVNNEGNYLFTTADNQFGAGCVLTLSGGTGNSRFEMLGTTQTVAGVVNDGTGRGVIQQREQVGVANVGSLSTLILNGSGNYSYGGYLRDAGGTLSVVKSGIGTQTLGGANISYGGNTTVNGGALIFNTTVPVLFGTSTYAVSMLVDGATLTTTAGYWLYHGYAAGSGATLTLTNNAYATIGNYQGAAGVGSSATLTLSSGTLTFGNANIAYLGTGATSTYRWNQTGGVATFQNEVNVANGSGTATLTISGGTFTEIGGWFLLSASTGASTLNLSDTGNVNLLATRIQSSTGAATVNMSGGTFSSALTGGNVSYIGYTGAGVSIWNQTGGVATFGNQVNVANGTGPASINISGGTLNATTAGDFYLGVSGNASLTISGNANVAVRGLQLGYGNAVTGTVTISSGTLTASQASILGSYPNTTSGSAVFTQTGGFVSFGNHVYVANGNVAGSTGVLSVNGGTFQQTAGVFFLAQSAGATVTFDIGGTGFVSLNQLQFATGAGGKGRLNLNAGGILKIAGTGGVTLGSGTGTLAFNGGTFQAGANISSAAGINTLVNDGGAVIDTLTNTLTISSALVAGTGNGGLTKYGAGTLVLAGTNTYVGGTTNLAGVLKVGAGGTVGVLPGNIVNSATLAFNRSDLVTYAGIISGSGQLMQVGSGTLSLTANQSYGGMTTITNGTLWVNAAAGNGITGDVTVAGGSLGGTGTVAGAVTVAFGGHVAPGCGTGIQSYGAVTFNNGSVLDIECDGTTNDQAVVTVNGGLVINSGWVNLYSNGTTSAYAVPGTYYLVRYDGAVGGSGIKGLSIANPVDGLAYSFSTNSGWVVLTVSAARVWDGGGSDDYWGTAANWNPDGTPAENDGLVFAGTSRLTPSNNTTAGTHYAGLTFTNSAGAFTLSGNAIALTGNIVNRSTNAQTIALNMVLQGNRVITNAGAGSVILSGGISETAGSWGLTKVGSGTLTVSGNNSHTGMNQMNAGAMILSAAAGSSLPGPFAMVNTASPTVWCTTNNQFGAGTVLSFSGGSGNARFDVFGTSQTLAGLSDSTTLGVVQNSEAVNGAPSTATPGTLTLAGSDTYTFGGYLRDQSGVLTLLKSGSGNQILNGSGRVSYSGPTLISAGTLTIAGGSALGNGNYNGNMTINGVFNFTSSAGQNCAGALTGSGTLIQNATSPYLYMYGAMTGFQGTFWNIAGVMYIGCPAGAGPAGAVLTVDGGQAFLGGNGAAGGTWALGALSGAGGSITPNGNAAGGTYVLQVGALNTATTYAGLLKDSGIKPLAVTKVGTGTLTLTGINTYSGKTAINAGRLCVDGMNQGAGTNLVASGATLGGIGSVAGPVVVMTNGVLMAGDPGVNRGLGTMTVSNTIALQTGAGLVVKIVGDQCNRVNATGMADVSAAVLSVDVSAQNLAYCSQAYTVLVANAVSGRFAGVPEGGRVKAGSTRYQVSYTSNAILLHQLQDGLLLLVQ